MRKFCCNLKGGFLPVAPHCTSAVCFCLSIRSAIDGNRNLCCVVQLCARRNMIQLLSVLQKKIGVCAHLVGIEIDWFLESVMAIRFIYHISEKNISKKKTEVSRKRRHWVTPLFRSKDDVFAELSVFFRNIL